MPKNQLCQIGTNCPTKMLCTKIHIYNQPPVHTVTNFKIVSNSKKNQIFEFGKTLLWVSFAHIGSPKNEQGTLLSQYNKSECASKVDPIWQTI